MPLGTNTFWAVVLPAERTNYCLNPSFELGTTGAAAIQSATLGSTSQVQAFGAWALSVTPNSNGTSGAALGTWTAANGSAYTVSAYVRGVNGVPYMIGVGDSNGVNLLGSTAFTGGGTWQRYSYAFTEAAGAVRRVVVRKTSGADTTAYYVDGVQIEDGSITTYVDGETGGGTWLGPAHAAQSYRSPQVRSGGSVVALADLGVLVEESQGIGMPPVENNAQSYAMQDGAQFQRQRTAARTFTLTSTFLGATWQDLHAKRHALIDAIRIDLATPQQPTRFVYTGAGGTSTINAVYQSGLEFGEPAGFAENVAVQFVAHDPYWYAEREVGTTLGAQVNLGSTNWIARRNVYGGWGTLGNAGTTTNDAIAAIVIDPLTGNLFLGGGFGSAAGTVARALCLYNPQANTFGTLTGGTLGGLVPYVTTLTISPAGTLIFGGNWTTIQGTANSRNVGLWNRTTYGTLSGGTLNQSVSAMAWRGGTLFVCGVFNSAGGTQAPSIAAWVNGAWGTLTGGTTTGAGVLAVAGDSSLYVANGTVVGGTANPSGIARWNGAWGTVAGSTSGGISAMAVGADGRIYLGGELIRVPSGSARGVAQYNGVQITKMGSGLLDSAIYPFNMVRTMVVDPVTGNILAGGQFFTPSGQVAPPLLAQWNGYTWLPLDIQLPNDNIGSAVAAILVRPDRTLYIAGSFAGTATAAAVGTIVNPGMANAYPVLKAKYYAASGTARLFQFVNYTTGDAIYFSTSLEPGETVTLDLRPDRRSFTSDFRGNTLGSVLTGSNLATFKLQPGTNYLSTFCDSGSVTISLSWTPRGWSADMGTIP